MPDCCEKWKSFAKFRPKLTGHPLYSSMNFAYRLFCVPKKHRLQWIRFNQKKHFQKRKFDEIIFGEDGISPGKAYLLANFLNQDVNNNR